MIVIFLGFHVPGIVVAPQYAKDQQSAAHGATDLSEASHAPTEGRCQAGRSRQIQAGQIINTLLISSFFRCGGDSRYGLMLDTISMWGVAVPLGLISAFVLKLPPIIVYALMCTDEFVKLPAAIFHYKKGGWIRNLTREFS